MHEGGTAEVSVNQRAAGGLWQYLGSYAFDPLNTPTVALAANDNGSVAADAIRFVGGPGGATDIAYLHSDHLGTPQAMTDANAQVLWWRDQTPFGQTVAEGGFSSSPLRFPGQVADAESSLAYNYFRDYDPALGRYIQSDPIGLRGGLNTYGYVRGNPLTSVDPLGLQDAFTLYPGRQTSDAVRGTIEDGMEYAGDAAGGASDFARGYSDMVDANTIGADLYFHCRANCEAAQRGKGGEDVAACISDAREWFDQNIKGDSPSASAADQSANRLGRTGGKGNPSGICRMICAPFRPKGLPQTY